MCGIVGIYYFDPEKKAEQRELKLMTDRMAHRGPNDEGFFVHDNVGLGMRRLSIIDLGGGHQPIFTPDKRKVIVFNGEVYNFIDHRPTLEQKGHKFYTKTDTEVVLHLYDEYDLDFFDKLNGMFGLAIWDDTQKQLLLVRDRIGIKPLYYYRDGEKIVFASEIKSILELPYIKAELDYQGLGTFLKYGFTAAPYTLFKNIHKIPPGHYMRIKRRDVEIKSYWRLSYANKHTGSEDEIGTQLYELLKSSVRYRLIADVPLGSFLSGGMDSSGIVHLMKELGTQTINTYSIGFGKGYEFYNELEAAGRFAKNYQTNHHDILVKPDVAELFPRLITSLDEPVADSSFLVTYLVSKLVLKRADESLFGNYPHLGA
jgi:asparagine synthase (glutamine-hydrolysing)